MKLLASVIVAAATANQAAESALNAGCSKDGLKPNAFQNGCISDDVCNKMENYRIFNHFYYSTDSEELTLVPECRKIDADITAGFACGTDTQLKHGSEVVIPDVPETDFISDDRSVKLLKTTRFASVKAALGLHCEEIFDDPTCITVNHFEDGCESTLANVNGYTVFKNFFTVPGCEAERTEHHDDAGWIEEYKIFVGYDDLVRTLRGKEITLDVHKVR